MLRLLFSDQSGIQTESCNEGEEDMGYIENGDYAVYNIVDFGFDAAGFQARVSSAAGGGNIECFTERTDLVEDLSILLQLTLNVY